MSQTASEKTQSSEAITLFLCGDVMTGRGIDQIMPFPSDPRLFEPYVLDARDYLKLAERANGPIKRPVDFTYIWGDALEELERFSPDVRIINLETSITTRNEFWPRKGINYRMHPKNIPCLTAAGIDCCVLANNHVLDWGYYGLTETVDTLHNAKIITAGAGTDLAEAAKPAIMEVSDQGRVIVLSFAHQSSGVPWRWAAKQDKPGINLLSDLTSKSVDKIHRQIQAVKRKGDIVVVSIHWGGNWGYEIPGEHQQFARQLIDSAAVDIIHGHSSHHPLGIEVYKNKPIIYGCGDFLNDYEGIRGYEEYRDDLALMYFISMQAETGKLLKFEMVPMQIKKFRSNRAIERDAIWLRDTLNREGAKLNTGVELAEQNRLKLTW